MATRRTKLRTIAQIYEGYRMGDRLTDTQVLDGMKHFKELADLLIKSGMCYRIAFIDANQVYLGLRDYAVARGITEL